MCNSVYVPVLYMLIPISPSALRVEPILTMWFHWLFHNWPELSLTLHLFSPIKCTCTVPSLDIFILSPFCKLTLIFFFFVFDTLYFWHMEISQIQFSSDWKIHTSPGTCFWFLYKKKRWKVDTNNNIFEKSHRKSTYYSSRLRTTIFVSNRVSAYSKQLNKQYSIWESLITTPHTICAIYQTLYQENYL